MKTSILQNPTLGIPFLLGLLLVCIATKAQNNTSYNANTIPINGSFCTAFGVGALASNATGTANIANGYQSLYSNTTGSNNTANGYQSLYSNTNGIANIANGSYALYLNTTGSYNIANGANALNHNTTGSSNVAIGVEALYFNHTGSNNVAIGEWAGFSNSYGSNNVFIGSSSGYSEGGSNKLYISNGASNALIYGDFATHQVLLGVPNATGYVFKGSRTLNVMGGILTDSVRVALSSEWADYVFDENYTLKPLNELEQFIIANKHLPNIPKAAEVKEKGINLAEINIKLLEKTEELTLYIIQQNKQIEQQNKRLEEQQNQIDELRKMILNKK